ncbi:MAG: 4-hydroxy-2-oxo-heptane-1,7-dioate aldolase [Chloroflexi bacterium]|nr:4-hydroxy-2-oxo-heptane-1,7-dioate aldolase [Chloroflexota bacterium]
MKNPLKERLNKGETVIGTLVGLGHPDVTEILSRIGFDYIVLDGEHSCLSLETMQTLIQAMNGSNCVPIIRPQWNDMVVIKRVLDLGAYGLLVPWINTKKDAEYAVTACRYPPEGLRGFGPRRASLFDPNYVHTANDEILVIAQIETRESVNNLNEILSVPGIDACLIGPFDLALSYGFDTPKWDNPEFMEAIDKTVEAALKWGKPAGLFVSQDNVQWARKKGFRLILIGTADFFLMQAAKAALEKARQV